jgi:hypothetical protein
MPCGQALGAAWHQRLPTFASLDELTTKHAAWSSYLDGVYGLSTLRFPFDMRQLTFFYRDVRPSLPLAPGSDGQRLALPWDHLPLLGRASTSNLTAVALALPLDEALVGARRPRHVCGRYALDAFHLYNSPPFPSAALHDTLWFYSVGPTLAAKRTVLPRRGKASEFDDAGEPWLAPASGFSSHRRVEVFHCAEESVTNGVEDYWLYLAPGSGYHAAALGPTLGPSRGDA